MHENHSSRPRTPHEAERELQNTRAQLSFILEHGLPMKRNGKFRYHGIAEPVWHETPQEAIAAAMQEFPARAGDVGS